MTIQLSKPPQFHRTVYADLDRQTLYRYARDTWQSMEALTCPGGLTADHITADGARAQYTSPTNIAAYLWSLLAARDLQIIPADTATRRARQTLEILSSVERHAPSGMYYNWYDPQSGTTLTRWPAGGGKIYPFLSSVDNGWLAAALILITNGMQELSDQALSLLEQMDFGFFLNPGSGLLRGGFWPKPPPRLSQGGFTLYDFGALNAETRISSYIGIAMGSLPPEHYFRMLRTCPVDCSWNIRKMQPRGVHRTYLDVDVFEGHYVYNHTRLVPSWGGSMFEALMPPLFVPEAQWGARSWGVNHPLYVQAQIHHGMVEARYGYWGFSPAANPSGGYAAYGVDAIGMNPDGYPSNNDNTLLNYRENAGSNGNMLQQPSHKAYTNGVVTPHAVFLALPYAPQAALKNLENLCQNFEIYGKWGFWDSVNVQTGQVSRCVLALDQGMVLAALANSLLDNRLQETFSRGMIERAIRPLLEMEEFSAGEAPENERVTGGQCAVSL